MEPLTSPQQILELVEELRSQEIIAFDTEFIRESTFFPITEIIQIATEKKSWLVDVRAFQSGSEYPGLVPLFEILQNPKILKVVHASQGDQECLYTGFGITAIPALDTSIAAALCGYGDGVGLGNLLKAVLGIMIKKGHARTNWAVRPLSQHLLEYAHADVLHLVRLGKKLLEELDKLDHREWALELSDQLANPNMYKSDPAGMALRLAKGARMDQRGYAALIDLVKWREERVRKVNVPRRWIADDQVLLDLALVRPKDQAHLASFRGLNKGELKTSGEALLGIFKKVAELQSSELPVLPQRQGSGVPTPEESQMMELLKCYIWILANQAGIATKYLMTTSQLLPLLRSGAQTPEDLEKQGFLTPNAARLVGAEVIELLKGKRALSMVPEKSGGVTVVKLD